MKALSDINLKISYRSSQDDLVSDFFVPCLERSTLYRRTAGYFSSSGLAVAAKGIAALAANGGKMRLVVSPELNDDDVRALNHAKENPRQALMAIVSRSMIDIEDALVNDQLNALAWLSANGHLELKLAMRTDFSGNITNGIFHEKTGIFTDNFGNSVSFNGSVNETAGGLVNNFESLKAFCSWGKTAEVVEDDVRHFDELWKGNTKGALVVEFSKEATQQLKKFQLTGQYPTLVGQPNQHESHKTEFRVPSNLKLRDYQKDAIRAWSNAKGKGIFSMATGSGKTLTALTLACKVAERNKPLMILVVCPYLNLCRQWMSEMSPFGLVPIECNQGTARWASAIDAARQRLLVKSSTVEVLVISNATYVTDKFQSWLTSTLTSGVIGFMMIVDEVHNLGSNEAKKCLHESISLRLGLSATPERQYDVEGTKSLFDYFGGVVYEYSLRDAINAGTLSPYDYYPIPVELTEHEVDEYSMLSQKIGPLMAGSQDGDLSEGLKALLNKRARLLGSAQNKITSLDTIIQSISEPINKAIFYCGDGNSHDSISDQELRQVEAVSMLLGAKHGLRVRSFTYKESPKEREIILGDFKNGLLDGIVAIRCLDEGIDLPDLRMGFLLASSTNERQFIQRRGRLLRRAPGKSTATIYDFFITPPDLGGIYSDELFNRERNMFKRELHRIADFCDTARNGARSLGGLLELRKKYNLMS